MIKPPSPIVKKVSPKQPQPVEKKKASQPEKKAAQTIVAPKAPSGGSRRFGSSRSPITPSQRQ